MLRVLLLAVLGVLLHAGTCAAAERKQDQESDVTEQPARPTSPAPTAQSDRDVQAATADSNPDQSAAHEVDGKDLAALVSGSNAFSLELLQRLSREDEGNLFLSPFSISMVLAMAYAGAGGDTAQQMADTLHYSLGQDDLHWAFHELNEELAERGGADGESGERFTLELANSIWGQQGYDFEQPFLDILAESYGAGMQLVDYVHAFEQARLTINDSVQRSTRDRIRNLLPEGALNAMTRLVLANAIYFKASWDSPFPEHATGPRAFSRLDGSSVTVESMRQIGRFRFGRAESYSALELPYVGGKTVMLVLLPDEGKFAEVEAGLDVSKLENLTTGMSTSNVTVAFPRFEVNSKFSLPRVLKSMGMVNAFSSDTADFSAMSSAADLYISKVFHQAFVTVDESGTEAAAATAVTMQARAMARPAKFIVDRPCVFLIRDIPTGTILFVGRVLDPSAA